MTYRALSRQTFLAAGLAAAAGARAGAQSLTPIRCASAPDDDVSPVLYAIQAGLFRKAGLDVSIAEAKSGSAVAAAVVGGSLEIGKSSVVSLIQGHLRGVPFVMLAPAATYSADHPIIAMIVAKDAPFTSPRELAGKIVSVPSLNDLNSVSTAAAVDAAGGDWHAVRYVELPSASAPDAVIAHRTDACIITTPALGVALDTGKVRILTYPFTAIARRFVQAAWFTTTDYAAKNADPLARFRRVLDAAANQLNAHPADSIAALAAFTKLDPQLIAKMPRATWGGTLEPKDVQPAIDAAYRYGAIASTFDARDIII